MTSNSLGITVLLILITIGLFFIPRSSGIFNAKSRSLKGETQSNAIQHVVKCKSASFQVTYRNGFSNKTLLHKLCGLNIKYPTSLQSRTAHPDYSKKHNFFSYVINFMIFGPEILYEKAKHYVTGSKEFSEMDSFYYECGNNRSAKAFTNNISDLSADPERLKLFLIKECLVDLLFDKRLSKKQRIREEVSLLESIENFDSYTPCTISPSNQRIYGHTFTLSFLEIDEQSKTAKIFCHKHEMKYSLKYSKIANFCIDQMALRYTVDFACVVTEPRATARIGKSGNSLGLSIYCLDEERDEGIINGKDMNDGGWLDFNQSAHNRIAAVYCHYQTKRIATFAASQLPALPLPIVSSIIASIALPTAFYILTGGENGTYNTLKSLDFSQFQWVLSNAADLFLDETPLPTVFSYKDARIFNDKAKLLSNLTITDKSMNFHCSGEDTIYVLDKIPSPRAPRKCLGILVDVVCEKQIVGDLEEMVTKRHGKCPKIFVR
jgi:hypothetical protein